MVERTAVNRDVVGSSPTWGVYIKFLTKAGFKQILSLELKLFFRGYLKRTAYFIRRHSQAVRRGSATP